MPDVQFPTVHCQSLSGKRNRPHGRTPALPASPTIQQRQPRRLAPHPCAHADQVRARSEVTLRGQALGSIGRLQRQGWSLMQQHDVHDLPARWWTREACPRCATV